MWLTSSSIGRKFVMALTGVCLVLFVTFHAVMNAVAICWPAAYNEVCLFLGANWYALVASAGLAALFIIHIIYACWLTIQNRKARGNDRYAVTALPPHVEWSSKNMLVLGIVILAFLCVHMIQFWAKMQLQELISHDPATWTQVNGAAASPAMGTLYLQLAFSQWWTLPVYLIGFVALWFHMNHGFWSMFQTAGWNGRAWLPRVKKIGCIWTSIVVVLFAAEAVVFTINAKSENYTKCPELQEQYADQWNEKAGVVLTEYVNAKEGFNKQLDSITDYAKQMEIREKLAPEMAKADTAFFKATAQIVYNFSKQCPEVSMFNPRYQDLLQANELLMAHMPDWRVKFGYEKADAAAPAAAAPAPVQSAPEAQTAPAPTGNNPKALALEQEANALLQEIQNYAQADYNAIMQKYQSMPQEELMKPEVQAQAQAEVQALDQKVIDKFGSQAKALVERFNTECAGENIQNYPTLAQFSVLPN